MNPFDDTDALFSVLTNDRGEHSLWPAFAEVPGGWTLVLGPVPHREATEYVQRVWAL